MSIKCLIIPPVNIGEVKNLDLRMNMMKLGLSLALIITSSLVGYPPYNIEYQN